MFIQLNAFILNNIFLWLFISWNNISALQIINFCKIGAFLFIVCKSGQMLPEDEWAKAGYYQVFYFGKWMGSKIVKLNFLEITSAWRHKIITGGPGNRNMPIMWVLYFFLPRRYYRTGFLQLRSIIHCTAWLLYIQGRRHFSGPLIFLPAFSLISFLPLQPFSMV